MYCISCWSFIACSEYLSIIFTLNDVQRENLLLQNKNQTEFIYPSPQSQNYYLRLPLVYQWGKSVQNCQFTNSFLPKDFWLYLQPVWTMVWGLWWPLSYNSYMIITSKHLICNRLRKLIAAFLENYAGVLAYWTPCCVIHRTFTTVTRFYCVFILGKWD